MALPCHPGASQTYLSITFRIRSNAFRACAQNRSLCHQNQRRQKSRQLPSKTLQGQGPGIEVAIGSSTFLHVPAKFLCAPPGFPRKSFRNSYVPIRSRKIPSRSARFSEQVLQKRIRSYTFHNISFKLRNVFEKVYEKLIRSFTFQGFSLTFRNVFEKVYLKLLRSYTFQNISFTFRNVFEKVYMELLRSSTFQESSFTFHTIFLTLVFLCSTFLYVPEKFRYVPSKLCEKITSRERQEVDLLPGV